MEASVPLENRLGVGSWDRAAGATTCDVEVFFDGDCPLCMREIRWLRRLDARRQRIRFTDIAAPGFEAGPLGFTQAEMMAKIKGRLPDGQWLEGVEVFRRLYRAVGLGPAVWLSEQPGLRWLTERAYDLFARNRLRLTGRSDACTTERCDVGSRRSVASGTDLDRSAA